MSWAFLKVEWFWTAVGAIAAVMSVIVALKPVNKEATAALSSLEKPEVSRSAGTFQVSVTLAPVNQGKWAITEVKSVQWNTKIWAYLFGLSAKRRLRFPSVDRVDFTMIRDGKGVSAPFRVKVISLTDPKISTWFDYGAA